MLSAAGGRVAAMDIFAPISNPPFPRSPLDGYTFRAADTEKASEEHSVSLRVVGEICAGQVFPGIVQPGEAVRIMTGAKIPAGCDCVLRQEDARLRDAAGHLVDDLRLDRRLCAEDGFLVEVSYTLQQQQNYCPEGEDIEQGTCLLKKDSVLKAAHIGVLASMGIASLEVWKRPRIVLCSTGDELTMAGTPLEDGKIYNSNLYILAARLQELGFIVENLGILPDDAALVAARIRSFAGQADLFLTTGGVSVGKKDIMHAVVKQLPAKRIFWRMAMKPGAPALAYRCGSLLGIALSGNPFAALATFELLVRPVLAKLSRRPEVLCQRQRALLADDFLKASPGRRFLRANYQNGHVSLPGRNASGMLFSTMLCNALLDIPAGTPALHAGEEVEIVNLY